MTILTATNSGLEVGRPESTSITGRDTQYSPSVVHINDMNNGLGYPFALGIPAVAVGTLWVHFSVYWTDADVGNSNSDGYLCSFYNSNNELIVRLDWANGNMFLAAYGDTTTTSPQMELSDDQHHVMDFKIDVTPSEITVSLHLNGAQAPILTTTAVNTVGAKIGPTLFVWDNYDLGYSGPHDMFYSEFIITDGEDTRGWRLATMETDAVGDLTGWTGGWEELGDRDGATRASADADGDRVSSGITDYLAGSSASLRAVVLASIVQRGQTGVSQLTQFLRIGGVNYDGSAVSLATGERGVVREIYDVNPATSAVWSTADLFTIQPGLLVNT